MKKVSIAIIFAAFSLLVTGQAVHIVNTANDIDDGVCNATHCSLREALLASNLNMGPDSIAFNIPGAGPHTISITGSALPGILDSFLVIDATTEPGNAPMSGRIILDGSGLSDGVSHGLVIYTRHTNIYGLQIQGFPGSGIQIFGGFVDVASISNISIGEPAKGNVIVENGGYGIEGPIDSNVVIRSNFIGTDLNLNQGRGNALDGIFVDVLSGSGVVIGGDRSRSDQNYLCQNGFSGLHVAIRDVTVWSGNMQITGNRIGTGVSGMEQLGNTGAVFGGGLLGGGIIITGDGPLSIGGSGGLANTIAFNYNGIYHSQFDQKTFLENQIYCNTNSGIELDGGANANITTPHSICHLNNIITGEADPNVMVDIYIHDDALCPGVPCQGETLVATVPSDAMGIWTYTWVGSPPDVQITALATDGLGNSSEFSLCPTSADVMADNTGPYCFGDSIRLLAVLSGNVQNATFEWFGPDGYMSTQQNPTDATLPGDYQLVGNVSGCKTDTTITSVVVYPAAADTLDEICLGDEFIINGNTYDIYNLQGFEVLPGAGAHGCDSTILIDLRFRPNSSVFIRAPSEVCEGDTIFMVVNISGGASGPFEIIYTDGVVTDTINDVFNGHVFTQVADQDLNFEVLSITTPTTPCPHVIGTSDSVRVSHLQIQPNVTDYSGFQVSCAGAQDGRIEISVNNFIGPVFYDWSIPTLTDSIADNLRPAAYGVTVSDATGCSATFDTVLIAPTAIEPFFQVTPSSCPGVDDAIVVLDAVLGAEGLAEWSLDSLTFNPITSFPVLFENLPPGPFTIFIRDSIQCTFDLDINIPVGSIPFVELGREKFIFAGDSVQLDYSTDIDPININWTPSVVLTCDNCPDPLAFPENSQLVYVTLEGDDGCTATDSVLINVAIPKRVYIPNVFSPNNDGANDFFFIQANEFATEVDYLLIVDRRGNVVFERRNFPVNNMAEGWDGTFDGEFMNPGVFTYLLRVAFSDNTTQPFSGTVTLVR